jgi:hypothetical protein
MGGQSQGKVPRLSKIPVITVDLPQYRVDTEPDHEALGEIVDAEIKRRFMGRAVLVRGIGSQDHPDMTVDQLVEIIKSHGTDRYDPARKGQGYENVENKHIDLFAFSRTVTSSMSVFRHVVWGFYHSAIEVSGSPCRIEILMIYNATKFETVLHRYEGRTDIKQDGFAFKNPERKPEALLGIFKIT